MSAQTENAKRVIRENIDVFDLPTPSPSEALQQARIMRDALAVVKARVRRAALRIVAVIIAVTLLGGILFSIPAVRAYIILTIERITGAENPGAYSITLERAELLIGNDIQGQYQTARYLVDGVEVELTVEPSSVMSVYTTDMDQWDVSRTVILPSGATAACYQDEDCAFAVIEQDERRIIVIVRAPNPMLLDEVLHSLQKDD